MVFAGIARDRLEQFADLPALQSTMLPFRIAALLAKAPDTSIAMPLAHVRRRQIADTWHAPRGKQRLHEGEDIFAPAGTPVYSATNGIVGADRRRRYRR